VQYVHLTQECSPKKSVHFPLTDRLLTHNRLPTREQ
jgi:hypothetical protein